ncbi:STAS domain-containing protein [Streptomyces sp. NPDC054787]
MDTFGSGPLRVTLRRYGPTVHVLLAGEADHEAAHTLDQMCARLPRDVAVVACDLQNVSFMDVSGLHGLIDLHRYGRRHGATVLIYNWQRQPLQLLRHLTLNHLDGHDGRDDDLRGLSEILTEHTEAQLALGIDAAHVDCAPADAPGPPPPTR